MTEKWMSRDIGRNKNLPKPSRKEKRGPEQSFQRRALETGRAGVSALEARTAPACFYNRHDAGFSAISRGLWYEGEEEKDGFTAATVENQPGDASQRFSPEIFEASRQTAGSQR
jgi:hypothetical protein